MLYTCGFEILLVLTWQDMADVLEAVVWERAKAIGHRRSWRVVAEEMMATLNKTWPAALCTPEQAASVAVKLDADLLHKRFERLAKKSIRPGVLRRRALAVLAKTQLYSPTESTPLWTFFRTGENTVVNKGALAQKNKTLAKAALERDAQRKPRQHKETAKSSPTAATPTTATAEERGAEAPAAAGAESEGKDETPPGLQRGGKHGGGRGGAIPIETKVAVRDLMVDDHIPARDIPKAVLDMFVLLHHRLPREDELFTHSKIKSWVCGLFAADIVADINQFWEAREKYGESVQGHIFHDGTRRTDPEVGHHGELMQFIFSYFHPGLQRGVWFVLSFRFTVGGSAAQTARALAVCLQDVGLHVVKPSRGDATVAFTVAPTAVAPKGDVICSIGSDNTGSALNVVGEYEKLTGSKLPGSEWPCPTHINALEGKNPTLALCGDSGTAFNDPNALNISDKWWYICDKHWNFVQHWWAQLKLSTKLARPKRGVTRLAFLGVDLAA